MGYFGGGRAGLLRIDGVGYATPEERIYLWRHGWRYRRTHSHHGRPIPVSQFHQPVHPAAPAAWRARGLIHKARFRKRDRDERAFPEIDPPFFLARRWIAGSSLHASDECQRSVVLRTRREVIASTYMSSTCHRPRKAGDPVTADSQGLLDAPLSPEVGLGRLRQLLGERNRKHPISRGMTRP